MYESAGGLPARACANGAGGHLIPGWATEGVGLGRRPVGQVGLVLVHEAEHLVQEVALLVGRSGQPQHLRGTAGGALNTLPMISLPSDQAQSVIVSTAAELERELLHI